VNKLYKVREFAELAGVTVRALHHYDRLALVRPARSGAGYRLYGIRDLERLEQVVALKFLGIPLKQIRLLLDRDVRELSDVLRSQRRALEEKRRRLDLAIGAIRDAERAIQPGRQTDAAVLKKIIEVIEMQENVDFMKRYYSEEAQAKMEERREQWNPELQAEATRAWTDWFRDVELALGEDPAGETAQALAARWKRLVEGFTGGDPQIGAGLKNAWADREHWPEGMKRQTAEFARPEVWEFIQRAMKCTQA
jgi:MerR family transcriptional regulator, thiopeptide resistance regulator